MRPTIYFLPILFLCACQSISVYAPGPLLETPLTSGVENRLGMQLGYRTGQYATITDNAGERPTPDFNQPRLKSNGDLYGGLSYAFAKRVEIRGDLGMATNLGIGAMIKYQFLGNPLAETAKGNFAMSTYGFATSGSTTRSGDQAVTFGPGGYDWKASLSMTGLGLGLSAGYSLLDPVMIFMAASRAWYNASYEVSHEASEDGAYPAADFSGTQHGSADAMGLGLNLIFSSKKASLFALYQKERRSWTNTDDLESWRWTGGLQVAF